MEVSPRIEGTVTVSNYEGLVLHDRTGGIWAGGNIREAKPYTPGDLVTVIGTTEAGRYSPQIKIESIKLNGHGPLPTAKQVTFEQLSSGAEDVQYVSVDGTIRAVSVEKDSTKFGNVFLKVEMADGRIEAILPLRFTDVARGLVDAKVRITATVLNRKNDNRQATGVVLIVSDSSHIDVLQPGPKDLFAAPLVPIAKLLRYRSNTDFAHRVRLQGLLTYYEPGKRLILQDSSQAIAVFAADSQPLRLGDRIEVVGFPAPETSGPVLQDAVVRRLANGVPIHPVPVTFSDALSSKYRYTLVSIEMHLVRTINEPSRTLFLLENGNEFTTAELDTGLSAPSSFAPGSLLRISGINLLTVEGGLNYDGSVIHSSLLIRALNDISLIEPASWWTPARLYYLVVELGIVTLAFLCLLTYVQLKRWKTEAVLQERERLANDVHDTLAQSFAGIGFQLQVIRKAFATGDSNLLHHIETARALVQFSHREARRSLKPHAFEDYLEADLLPSLETCAHKLVENGSVQIEALSSGPARQLSRQVKTQLYRIGQEAIANAIRHADPMRISIKMEHESDVIRLHIIDDGAGFTMRGDLLGFGIRGMRKRASDINADLNITSSPGAGTCVTVTVPAVQRNLIISHVVIAKDHVKSILERGRYATDKQ